MDNLANTIYIVIAIIAGLEINNQYAKYKDSQKELTEARRKNRGY